MNYESLRNIEITINNNSISDEDTEMEVMEFNVLRTNAI